MRASFRFSSSLLFVVIGSFALLALIVSVVVGGFGAQFGPLRFSVHDPRRPLLVALLAWVIATSHGRAAMGDALASLTACLDRHATMFAILIAASTAGAGVAYGTYSASAADASGYVSQSALVAEGRITIDEPLAHDVGWTDATWSFSPLGYRPGQLPGQLVPTYAPGLPLAMAAVRRLSDSELALYFVVPLLGALAVLATYGLGRVLHSSNAGIVGALLLATSPIFLFQLVLPMSDVPATALWALALWLAALSSVWTVVAAGAVAGCAVLVRPNLVPLVLPVALLAAGWLRNDVIHFRPTMRRLACLAVGLTPAIAFLLLLQSHLYGDALRSGYGPIGELYSLSNVAGNTRGYIARILSSEWPSLTVGLACLVVLTVVRKRHCRLLAARRSVWLAALVCALLLASYLPYGLFQEWHYLRFLLPAFPPAFVCVGALLANVLAAVPSAGRGLALLGIATIAVSLNIRHADRESAFRLRDDETRYRTAGRYLAAALPRDTVILAVQESGSARYYTGLTVFRWDLAPFDLDAAVARLSALGRNPVLLVEDFETADLQRRFPRSPLSRLDWSPRADFGTVTRVRLFDPSDRRPGARVITDRLR